MSVGQPVPWPSVPERDHLGVRLALLRFGVSFRDVSDGESDSELAAWFRDLGFRDQATPELDGHVGGPPRPTSITLFLTTACNLGCTYCYASTGERPVESLDEATAKRGIDVVITNAVESGSREIGLAFHGGGEPSVVAWAVLTNSLIYARTAAAERGLVISASITTNAVLSEAKAAWSAENLDLATVSCDGLPEVQTAIALPFSAQAQARKLNER